MVGAVQPIDDRAHKLDYRGQAEGFGVKSPNGNSDEQTNSAQKVKRRAGRSLAEGGQELTDSYKLPPLTTR
eukprot:8584172-Pyramimonas_sp.AAC.1